MSLPRLTRQSFSLRLILFSALLALAASSAFAEKFDYDFTKMNYNMATAVVFDMMVSPGDYENKSARITGEFASELHEGVRLYAVIMWDATGCCPTGLTVVPQKEKKYPDDFPKEGSQVTVTGKMKSIEMFGGWSLCLVVESWQQ